MPLEFPTPDATSEMRSQVEALARENGISIKWSPTTRSPLDWLDATGDLTTRKLEFPPITTELDYFVALHEIGHVVLSLPTYAEIDGKERASLDNEVEVWSWVLETALIAPSSNTQTAIYSALHSHLPDSGQQPGHPSFERLRQILSVPEWNVGARKAECDPD